MFNYKIVGNHPMQIGLPEDCIVCGNAEWGGVFVEGVCGRCLYTAWQQNAHRACIKCGEYITHPNVAEAEKQLSKNVFEYSRISGFEASEIWIDDKPVMITVVGK